MNETHLRLRLNLFCKECSSQIQLLNNQIDNKWVDAMLLQINDVGFHLGSFVLLNQLK